MRTCKNCIWRDQCAADAACEHFSPADDSAMDEIEGVEYFFDLTNRQHEYMREIYEMEA